MAPIQKRIAQPLKNIVANQEPQHESNENSGYLSQLLVHAPIIIWSVDRQLHFLTLLGGGSHNINEVSRNKLKRLTLYTYFGTQDDHYPPIAAHHNALMGQTTAYIYTHNEKTYNCHVEPTLTQHGEIVGVSGWAIDITEQKKTEDALQQRILALTQPLDNFSPPRFEDLFNLEEIQKIQDAFAEATGVASVITDTNGRPITRPSNFCRLCLNIIRNTEKGLANCMLSDAVIGKKHLGGPILQPCLSGGLWDGGASICVGDHHIANWLIGQILEDTQTDDKILAYGQTIGADSDAYKSALSEVTRMSKTQFEKICNALFLIANQLSLMALQNVHQARFISERQNVEADLAKERNLLRTLIYTLPDAIYAKDAQGRKTMANHGDLENIGVTSEEEVIGKTDADLFPPEIAAQFMSDEEPVLKNGVSLINHEETIIFPEKNQLRWLLTTKIPLFDKNGNVTGLIGIGHDITARKQAEEEIRRLNIELEQRVLERTAELEMALHEIESFSYSVSHDLRAPLRSINGFSQILLEDYANVLDAEGQSFLDRIRKSSQYMSQLIDDILKISRVTRSEIQRETVDLSILTQTILAEYKAVNPGREVEVIIASKMVVFADPSLMYIAMNNLLNNALKFTAKHPKARIEVGQTDTSEGIAFFVKDDGAGFDMAYASKLFGAFQRLHSPAEFEGTGIGLATVQRIIHRHGGKIWAQSAPEQGAVFYFTIRYPEYFS